MKIVEIYKNFKIPPNLQEHMLRVYGIVCFIEKHWKGEHVNWELVKKIALLHDMGNIIKFNLDKHPEFLGAQESRIDYWKKVQKEIIQKYGSDEEAATRKMLEEVQVDKKSIQIIEDKAFGNSINIKDSSDWRLKLLYYADLRTLPFGVGTLEERLSDVRARMPKYTSRLDFEDLVSACREIEQQIKKNIDLPVSEITATSSGFDKNILSKFEI
ncbi:MAG TPA: HD domain-containing protein [Patescibacteria group bacterium]|nr:HD domain-containing protein [Patescibacteria group bacterium]